MGKINLLPQSVANQIAAGEVVNRPASIIKEMVENAVDAGSRSVTVNFSDGGKELIQIVDDGCGMATEDARMAFERHATSKIQSVEDIYNLRTFGFRGEALASIAAVSEVELVTRREEDEVGTKVVINAGKFVSQEYVNASAGSNFIVKNLFYNLPARRRFIDKSSTESRHIIAEFQRVALCNPSVKFELYDNHSLKYSLPATSLKQRIVGVVGKSIEKALLDLSTKTTVVDIEGFVGSADYAKKDNKEQFLFVNGRYFRSPYLHKAIVMAYEKLIPQGTSPAYFIYLNVDPAKVDVNIHPQKTEVKFEDGTTIWQILNAAVREALAKLGVVPLIDFDVDSNVEIPLISNVQYKEPKIAISDGFNPFVDKPKSRGSVASISDFNANYEFHNAEPQIDYFDTHDGFQSHIDIEQHSLFSGVLPINSRYTATTIGSSLAIVDLRRAFEMMCYERFTTLMSSGAVPSQRLLFTDIVPLSLDDMSLVKEYGDQLREFGFEVVIRDENSIEIEAVPSELTSESPTELLYDIIDAIRDGNSSAVESRQERIATMFAERNARGKKSFLEEEITSLMEFIAQADNRRYTPTGREIVKILDNDTITKLFK